MRRNEVYVVSFPNLGGKQQVSREGGGAPRWFATGQGLFFLSRGRLMMARRLLSSGVIAWQNPASLFDVALGRAFVGAREPDSFYFFAPNPKAPAREIRVVQNWFEELKRFVPTN
jgi:hypothetical protein